jgi:hypothetical protein
VLSSPLCSFVLLYLPAKESDQKGPKMIVFDVVEIFSRFLITTAVLVFGRCG